ncbi:hypothetical protein [Chryseosolibacter indicus]|uniref:Uncharacterized protein n=1 Tax=Chryseosolibacter indicus TaxID=2782351 RepID=A0ABS5VL92_9BACT|nr:hypothetical protein [Chryseosolibacter indicus]MBT1702220.1 hypothetical protein [Chryseosolibacter indicus]
MPSKGGHMNVFDNLDFGIKRDIIKRHATLVLKLDYFNYEVRLYSWDKYFIEEYFETSAQKVTRISLASEKDLLKFIRNICITDLGFNCLS